MADTLSKAGRYQILEELGRGSMGVVYKGYDPVIGRTVAIKTMRADTSGEGFEEFSARFKSEARAAGILSHPNIVTIYDFGEDQGILYLAMELLSGKSLQQVLREEHVLSVAVVLPIYEQVSRALDHAHRRHVVHRDIKPGNIMVLDDGIVKVADFGIAKVLGSGSGMTHTGLMVGTPNYMSPEQVRGQAIDGRTDIFALGVILYEVLTGQRPFAGQNITTVIYKIINEDPAPIAEPAIHPGLWKVISKALAKKPDERYQTCWDLFQDLKSYQNLGGAQGTQLTLAAPAGALLEEPGRPEFIQSLFDASAPTSAQIPRPAELGAPQIASSQLEPTPSAPAPKRTPLVPVIAAVLVILLSAGGYLLYHRTRVTVTAPPVTPVASSTTKAPVTESNQAQASLPATGPPVTATETTVSAEGAPETPIPPPATGVPENSNRAATLASKETGSQPKDIQPRRNAAKETPGKESPRKDRKPPEPKTAVAVPVVVKTIASSSPPTSNPPASKPPAALTNVAQNASNQPAAQPTQTVSPAALTSANTSQFLLETDPTGLDAVIDGKPYGKTPVVANLSIGKHNLVLKSMGVDVMKTSFQQGIDDTYKKYVLPITRPVQ